MSKTVVVSKDFKDLEATKDTLFQLETSIKMTNYPPKNE